MREVYVQSLMASTLQRLTPAITLDRLTAADQTQTLVNALPVSQLSYIRPTTPLPVEMTSFDQQALIDKAFALGEAAAGAGFTPYDADTFR